MPENTSIIFRVVNFLAAAFMIIGSVSLILLGFFPSFILAVICIIFAVITIVFEFKLPGQITQFASIMFSFLGRGIFYLIVGCILLNYAPLSIASGAIIIVIAVVYIILHFVPSIEPPRNMQMSAFEESIGLLRHLPRLDNHYPSTTPNTPMSNANYNNNTIHSPSSMYSPPPIPQETTPYPQKTYIPNESHIV
ncbi:unnamed protein product [Cunninghamella blakesleeana]